MSTQERAERCRRALVSGRVQGVAFRYYTRQRAEELALAGWVRNLPDGRVETHVEGPAEAVEQFLAWLGEGPPSARVKHLEVSETELADLRDFKILH